MEALEKLKSEYDPADEAAYFCGYYIDSINLTNLLINDKPRTMAEAKKVYNMIEGNQ